MWLTSGRASCRKTLLKYYSLTPLERECYEGEVQPYRKTDYKTIIYIYILDNHYLVLYFNLFPRGSHSTNNRQGQWFKFNDTVIEEFDLTDATLETECFGGSYKAKVFETSMYNLYENFT